MDDAPNPRDVIAHAIQSSFPNRGDWHNWQPLAELILAQLAGAGLAVAPIRQLDVRPPVHVAEPPQTAAP
jgi:hypothetical protein